jgi:hypothetical protein
MDDQIETILLTCLDAMEQGETPEAILARYPEHAPVLRRALDVYKQLPTLQQPPSRTAQALSQQRLVREAAALRVQRVTHQQRRSWRLFVAICVLVLLVVGGGLTTASQSALPGEPLYAVKRGTEQIALSFAWDETAREQAAARFEQERRDEVAALLRAKRTAAVEVRGEVEQITDDMLLFNGFPVQITPETHIDGVLAIGRTVRMSGSTRNGVLVADSIIVDPDNPPLPTPTATDVPPSPIIPTRQPTATPRPTRTPQPTATFIPEPEPTATVPPATATVPPPPPTATVPPPPPLPTATVPPPPPPPTATVPPPPPPQSDDEDEDDDDEDEDDDDEDEDDDEDDD